MEGSIYFKNVNDCMHYKNALHNQSIMKKEKEQTYQCMCKLVPQIDPDKVRIY
tara:strand:- start:378 stop:536 length:159 start_codon:yes stop_codon:yes gene_type:complete